MRKTSWQPDRLDVEAFAKAGAQIEVTQSLQTMPRLQEGLQAPADGCDDPVAWSAEGLWSRATGDSQARARIRLRAHPTVWLTCQRCLQPVAVPVAVDRTLCFVDGEDEASRLDEDRDDEDVLALSRAVDLRALVEDELIMALPLVPRHEACPQPLPWSAEAEPQESAADRQAHPFAALEALKGRG